MDGLQNNSIATAFVAKFNGLFPRAYKDDGSGLITAFELQEVHLNVNNQAVSISGTVTVKKSETESETIPVLWNHVGLCYSAGKSIIQFDLVRKISI